MPSLFAWPSFNSLWLQTLWFSPPSSPRPGCPSWKHSGIISSIATTGPMASFWLPILCPCYMGTKVGFGVQIKFSLSFSLSFSQGGTSALQSSNHTRASHGEVKPLSISLPESRKHKKSTLEHEFLIAHFPFLCSLFSFSPSQRPQRKVFFYFFSIHPLSTHLQSRKFLGIVFKWKRKSSMILFAKSSS